LANFAHLGNNIYVGLTSDTKPTAANTTNGAIAIEWATDYSKFIIYINNQTTWLAQTSFSETLAGKTLTTPIVNGVTYGDVAITNSDSPYTVLATKKVIRADATSGAITINLPTAVGIAGREYHIFRTDVASSTNIITIDANSTETIDSSLTYRLYPGEYVKIESDGANWQVLARPQPNLLGYYFLKGSSNDRRYLGAHNNITTAYLTSTTSPAANTLWAYPFIVAKTTKFDTISFIVSTASTSGNSRAGIYADNGNNYPGALIFDTGSIDTHTATGEKNTTITSSLQVFQPGLYWLAYEQDTATGQYKILNSITTCMQLMGFTNTASNSPYHYNVAHTYGTLPDPYTAGATLSNVNSAVATPLVAVGLRAV
jgi:hypothetical protein